MEEYKARETWPIIICPKKALFVIGEMKIKTLMRYLFILIWMATIKKTDNNKHWQGCREIGTVIHC